MRPTKRARPGTVIVEQRENAEGYRGVAVYGEGGLISTGYIVTGRVTGAFVLRDGEVLQIEQHGWYARGQRWLVTVSNQGGTAVILLAGRRLAAGERHTPVVVQIAARAPRSVGGK